MELPLGKMSRLGIALRRWRMRRMLGRNPIPRHIWRRVTRRMVVLSELDAVQMAHLREMATWFVGQKPITGAQGLKVTASMKVTVAAQACLLILNLGLEYFDGLAEVVLYPGAFRVYHEETDSSGLVHDGARALTGESWLRGPVILSWNDVARDVFRCQPGHNVVLHEFAHKLDGLNGATNGMPPLRSGMSRKCWAKALGDAYAALCHEVNAGAPVFINPYATTNPAEFFAVLSEYFFTAPDILKRHYPSAYKQLSLFYR